MPACPTSQSFTILPGSFRPLHDGHRQLAKQAELRTQRQVHFELSIANVDKPSLALEEVQRRLAQFHGWATVWITQAARFDAKAKLFPHSTFVIGFDTAARLWNPKYYRDAKEQEQSLWQIAEHGCRFLVAGRVDGTGTFREWTELQSQIPKHFETLFEMIPEQDFRLDVSSTELRQK